MYVLEYLFQNLRNDFNLFEKDITHQAEIVSALEIPNALAAEEA